MYGPGKPPYELKHKEVSSVKTGPFIILKASSTFFLAISYGSPYNSGKFIF